MRYYQFIDSGQRRLAVATETGMYDITSARPKIRSFGELLRGADMADKPIDRLVESWLNEADHLDDIPDSLRMPIDAEEVWAAGVTYEISEEARETESDTPDIYLNVYDADRPEVFFKATPSRIVGPNDAVGIRSDSEWNVPEPELGIVLYDGQIVGYTIGNDISSRSIEGENPLYLPQAKTYDRCCSIGPCVATTTSIEDPHDLTMAMTIARDGDVLYDDQTSTANMIRTCEELVSYYTRHNAVPEFAVLLTGTSLVPEDDFTLREDDHIEINIEGIGTLTNDVTPV
ncbi:fumarylacetoacetate hydrolase family protein [Haloprofundus salilacus]|uniref:fumarylacetoacetate hydrolase family protein n=1 Tax=Haloprofundus salilacus TaxID=2876190 RepID=UPI001CCD3DFB|nr:fumarylacetoacetate hydrolase family protein [Haloprofundus salilacus]